MNGLSETNLYLGILKLGYKFNKSVSIRDKNNECSCASMHLHYSSKMMLCRKYKKKCIIVRSETSNHPRICENFISEALTKVPHVFNGLHIDNCPTVAYLRDLDIAF